MSSFDKVVKLACKPKAAPPKAKYLDPIIAATWSEDGAVHDVCKALSPRFREPNAIVVFKALIVLHTMIRNGATDNVLSYLSSGDVLRLRNVATGQWEGYDTPQNLTHYAFYLDSRVRAYRDLKHDAVRVQSESNRDMRFSQSVEDSRMISSTVSGPKRSKTIMGRKLRSMTVEKGLLRETKAVHRMIDALIECKFYLDNLEDELTITALRMLVKDLLVLFQAGNEGVINVLEHYCEMSHVDAEQALAIYRHFCKQTEHVMEYLAVVKKLQNLLNVPIPNLKYAPVSLAGALEEYLKDPNFEQNRIEYRANKAAADGNPSASLKSALKSAKAPASSSAPPVSNNDTAATSSSSSKPGTKTETNKAMIDFFASIESDQEKVTTSPAGSVPSQPFQNQLSVNPFIQQQSMTSLSNMSGPFSQQQQSFIQTQQTGFIQPQQTAFQTSPFPLPQQPTSRPFLQLSQQQATSPFQQQPQSAFPQQQATSPFPQQQATNPFPQQRATSPFQQQPQSTFPPPQATSPFQQQPQSLFPRQQATSPFQQRPQSPFPRQQTTSPFQQQSQSTFLQQQPTGFLQPQATGSNPFRQSMLLLQSTGTPAFTSGGNIFEQSPSGSAQALGAQGTSYSGVPSTFQQSTQPSMSSPIYNTNSPFTLPNRPQSTPLLTHQQKPSQTLNAVVTHQTGSKNPFGIPVAPAPPVPKLPTLQELTTGAFGPANGSASVNGSASGSSGAEQTLTRQPTHGSPKLPMQSGSGGSIMASVASSFATNPATQSSGFGPTSSNPFPNNVVAQHTSTTTSFSEFSSLSSNPTGSTSATTTPSTSSLHPQQTGFGGIKPFKPSSSFGANLLESLPPVAGSPSSSPSTLLPANDTQPPPTNAVTSLPTSNPLKVSFNLTSGGPRSEGLTGQAPALSALSAQRTGLPPFGSTTNGIGSSSSLSGGLRPQMTGGANPFRLSMMASSSSAPSFPANPPFQAINTTQSSGFSQTATGTTNLTGNAFGGISGQTPFNVGLSNQNQTAWKPQNGSLI